MNPNDQNQSSVITLLVKVPVKVSSMERAKAALMQDVQGAWTEPGNYKMELYSVDGQEHIFCIFERWKDLESLHWHFQQPYVQGAVELQKSDLAEPAEMNYLMDHWPVLPDEIQRDPRRPFSTVITSFEVLPGTEMVFVALFEAFVPLVRAQSGNVDYHFYSVIGKPQSFVLYERWESQSCLDAHNRLPHTPAFLNSLSGLLQMPLSDCILHVTDLSSAAFIRP